MKITMRDHLILVSMASINKIGNNECVVVEKRVPLFTAGRNVNWHSHYGKQHGSSSKIKIELPYDPRILLLVVYLKN